jgi:hypothetical protein
MNKKVKDVSVSNLILELGRMCNRQCEHCLRGKMEDKTIDIDSVKKILSQINYANCITFSGGEPLLYAKQIIEIIDYIMEEELDILNFYMASNGELYDEELVDKLYQFYNYANEIGGGDICAYDISDDQFHRPDFEVVDMLSWLPFYTARTKIPERGIISEGLAEENGIGYRTLDYREKFLCTEYDGSVEIDTLYISAEGRLFADCDFSYQTQRELRSLKYDEKTLIEIVTDTKWCEYDE